MNEFEREIIDRLARIEENLKDHIRRTELLEIELKPLKAHVHYMNGSLKLVGIIGTLAAIALTVSRLLY